jgi:tripartite-type tricarboxylate transporter receptor subunit TctC
MSVLPLRRLLLSAFVFVLTAATPARAEEYPVRPVHVIVPYAPGGGADFVARTYAQSLSDEFGQAFVVENRGGANGNIGGDYVAKAKPDGYTILLSSVSTLSANVSLYATMPFDILKDLTPISVVSSQPNILVVTLALPVRTIADLIALAKARPGQLTYGSAGVGSGPHLSAELFKIVTGVDIVHVPYRGAGPATVDLLAGNISLMFNNLPPSLPLVAAAKLRAIAVTGPKRAAAAPDVPTMAEAGYPSVEMTIVNALFAPAGTPPAIIDRLNTAVARIARTPKVQQSLAVQGVDASSSTPAELRQMLVNDTAKWANVVRRDSIHVE